MIGVLLSDRWYGPALFLVSLFAAGSGLAVGAALAYVTRPRPPRTPITWDAID